MQLIWRQQQQQQQPVKLMTGCPRVFHSFYLFILFIHLFIHLFLDFFSISFPFPGGRNGSVYTTAIDADKASGDAVWLDRFYVHLSGHRIALRLLFL